MQETVLVATAGQGILRSSDRGQTWRRLDIEQDIEFDAVVRCVVPHPDNPATIYAGTETGLCVSEDAGVTWKQVETAMNGYHIWQLVIDARNPQRMFAGTGAPSRALMFRSMDGGANWEQLPPELPEFCMGVNRPRIVTIALDPNDASEVWFGVEETGAFRSRDNGDTWERVDGKDGGIGNSDIHSILILAGPPKTHMVLVVTELYVSKDDGETWKGFNARDAFGLRYSRVIANQAGSNTVYLGVGDGTPGTTTRVLRSQDLGDSWDNLPLPIAANSCTWAFATHPADPNRVFFGTKYGHLYSTDNGGDSWRREWREFSEITDLAWVPVQAGEPAAAH